VQYIFFRSRSRNGRREPHILNQNHFPVFRSLPQGSGFHLRDSDKMETFMLIQGDPSSSLAPLILIHAISGLALPYFALGSLTGEEVEIDEGRPVYGISSPIYSSGSHRLPSSLEQVAYEYVSLMMRKLLPRRPFILGGWSMGGMIAMKMADILQRQNLSVLGVIMVDSTNPVHYPQFSDALEHKAMTLSTLGAIKKRTVHSREHGSNTSSDDESFQDNRKDDHVSQMFKQMHKHIFNGLSIISKADGRYLDQRCQAPVFLIKCSILEPFSSAVRSSRRRMMMKRFEDAYLGWNIDDFGHFEVLLFQSSHGSVLDGMHSGILTELMRDILSRV
jgi:thioesterase domain-containing protein